MPRRRDDYSDYDSEDDIEISRRHRSGSNRLNVSYENSGRSRHRSRTRDHEDVPQNINIYNTADAYQQGPRQTNSGQRDGRAGGQQAGFPYGYPVVQPQIIQQPAPAPVAQAPQPVMIMPGAFDPYAGRDKGERRRHHRRSPSSSRSRSHSRSHSPRKNPYEEEEWRKRVLADARRKDDEEKAERKAALERYKVEQARKEEEEREERKAAIEKYKLDSARKDEAEKAERKAAIERYKREQERKEEEEEELEREVLRKHEAKIKEEEDEKKKVWEEYEAKRKAQEAKKKEADAKADEAYKERMRKHLAKCGYASNQIETVIEMEKLKISNETAGTMVMAPKTGAHGHVIPGVRSIVYPKIRRKDIAAETLKNYDLEWEYCADDSNYIIILQEMTEYETSVLFTHTERLREKGGGTKILAIEEKKERGRGPELLLVREKKGKHERSKSRGRDKSQVRGARFAAGVLGL